MTKKQRRTIERLVQQVIDDHESFSQKWLEERNELAELEKGGRLG